MIPLLIAIVLGLLAFAYVLYPLYSSAKQRGGIEQGVLATDEAVAMEERGQTARAALQEIELDHQLGNISEQEYSALREPYIRRALVALKSRNEREQELDEEIEEQLRSMKEQGKNAADYHSL